MSENNNRAKWSAAPWHGKVLVDGDGDTIGKLQDVYVDVETAPPGQFGAALGSAVAFDYVLHQATGMVAAQLEVKRGRGPGPFAGLRLRQRPAPAPTWPGTWSPGSCVSTPSVGTATANVTPDLPVGRATKGDA